MLSRRDPEKDLRKDILIPYKAKHVQQSLWFIFHCHDNEEYCGSHAVMLQWFLTVTQYESRNQDDSEADEEYVLSVQLHLCHLP